MSFSLFISKKYTLSGKKSGFITLISSIAVAGIALGVATLIIAVSILGGFERTLTEKISDFDAHIKILTFSDLLPANGPDTETINNIVGDYQKSASPYFSRLAVIGNKRNKEGVNIKGIRESDEWSGVSSNIVSGSFSLNDGELIIGQKLATKLFVKTGDEVVLFALRNNELPSPANPPNIMKLKVSGIFESGMAQYDDIYAYVNLKQAQELFTAGNVISGYDIRLNDVTKADSLAYVLSENLRYPYYARSIFHIHRNIFTWIELQKKPIPIVLGLIILVAVFNIIGTLLMLVLEKVSAIGILKSLGAGRNQITAIFLYQGIILAMIGISAGNLLAYLLLKIQQTYEVISLPSSVYFVSSVPVSISLSSFLIVSVITFILSLAASTIPSIIASKIKPVSTLRFS